MSTSDDKYRVSLPALGGLASTGHPGLDRLMDKLRLGDNVVWHVDDLDDYREFVGLMLRRAHSEGRKVVYVRFANHEQVVPRGDGEIRRFDFDPGEGFDQFSRKVNLLAEAEGPGTYYVFDCLSELVERWGTENMLANFFQTACPFLYDMRTIAYFAILRQRHSNQMVARVYNTTQVFIELFRGGGQRLLRLIKVWDRYSPDMFALQRVDGDRLWPTFDRDRVEAMTQPEAPAAKTGSPWESLHERLKRAIAVSAPIEDDLAVLKEEFVRMLVGRDPTFNRLGSRYLNLQALLNIRERLIGSGRIGGKAVGMLLAREILKDERDGLDDPAILEEHDSWFIGSDVYYTYLVQNELFRVRIETTRPDRPTPPFEDVEARFLAGYFPPETLAQFRNMLEHFGPVPIIVRSSSLLEDSFGGAFAGKYRSEFCPNQGTLDERLEQLTRAIKLVYASSLGPDAVSYRRRRNLENKEELMAVLVQRVSGSQYRKYFFPTLAGVAFSRNLYAWNDRIDPRQGVIRLVFGLGTRAVDRVGGDYPRLIAVSHPQLRPEVGSEAAKYSQHEADVINLDENTFVSLPVSDVLNGVDYPNLHYIVSRWKDGHLEDPFTRFLKPSGHYILTFNNLIRQTPLVRKLGEILAILEKAYGRAVDIEFTAFFEPDGRMRVNLLQCRPLWMQEQAVAVEIPRKIPDDRILFRAQRVITGGVVESIRFIAYIDPEAYSNIDYPPDKKTLGRVVGRLNTHPAVAPRHFILMGPGRWGSSNVDLGVNVSYADIDNANVLVELSSAGHGHIPEVSYGTHFFQDLVEEHIIYVPVFTERGECAFARDFFRDAPNHLGDFLPDYTTLGHVLKFIDLEKLGLRARLLANPQDQEAVCYLVEGKGPDAAARGNDPLQGTASIDSNG